MVVLCKWTFVFKKDSEKSLRIKLLLESIKIFDVLISLWARWIYYKYYKASISYFIHSITNYNLYQFNANLNEKKKIMCPNH